MAVDMLPDLTKLYDKFNTTTEHLQWKEALQELVGAVWNDKVGLLLVRSN